MIKRVITEETLPQYLGAIKAYESNHIRLEPFTTQELADRNLIEAPNRFLKFQGGVRTNPPSLIDHCFVEKDVPESDADKDLLIIRITEYSDTEFCGLSAVEGSVVCVDRLPTSPVGLEYGTVYITNNCLRIV